ncbi:MAG TPA: response regulator [Candidatus Cloacimonadota bacterium]|nr:response regulator [Candidatus Cloacimonadota bacterium]
MTETLYLSVCSHFRREVDTILAEIDNINIKPLFYPPLCIFRSENQKVISHILDNIPDNCILNLLTGCMIAEKDLSKNQDRIVHLKENSCFYFLLNAEMVDDLIAKGNYLLSPGWLIHWREYLKHWGFSQDLASDFFKESAKQLVLLDTGLIPDIEKEIDAFSKYVNLPYQIIFTGISHFRPYLNQVISRWLNTQKKQTDSINISEIQKKNSDLSMALDILSHLSAIYEENTVIHEVQMLFSMLFAPKSQCWIKTENQQLLEIICDNQDQHNELQINQLLSSNEKYLIDEQQNGFILNIGLPDKVAVLCISKIKMPEYLTQYLNLAVQIADVCSVIIKNCRYHKQIREQKEEILKQKEIAESASKAKSLFLANMSHEIRTPLNSVIGFTDLLLQTQLNDIQKQYAYNSNISGQALLGIINDILDFSKIEAGKMELEYIQTDLIEIVEKAIDIVRYPADKKGIELILNVQPDIPNYGDFDPIHLQQILINLLNNAIKFTEKGDVELKINYRVLEDSQIEYQFSVIDTGIGMSETEQQKLFKAFSLADSSTTRRFGGTGLGLIISKLLVEKMNGHISVFSSPGKGSQFIFTIKTKYQALSFEKTNDPLKIKTVLLVDDNPKNLMILKDYLKHWNISTVSCSNGLEALKTIHQGNQFDLMIIDYMMPYLDGIETVRKIRNKLLIDADQLPIILLHSSLENQKIQALCHELKIRFNLNKPLKSRELYQYLRNLRKAVIQDDESSRDKPNDRERFTLPENCKILIAEDIKLNMILIRSMLLNLIPDAVITEAKNGLEAVSAYQSGQFDLILMDVQMPEMDGLQATIEIRKQEIGRHTPIIALTAGVSKDEQENCLNSGMDDFLKKPVEPDQLKEKIFRHGLR